MWVCVLALPPYLRLMVCSPSYSLMLRQSLALLFTVFGVHAWYAQGISAGDSTAAATPSYQTVDGIVAVIGDEIVLASDIR